MKFLLLGVAVWLACVAGSEARTCARVTFTGTAQGVTGTLLLEQTGHGASRQLTISGKLNGLGPTASQHGLFITTLGDISSGCTSVGAHFSPDGNAHGTPGPSAHAGDLGNIDGDNTGAATVSVQSSRVSLCGKRSVIGRAMVVTASRDDGSVGSYGSSIACGVIGHAVCPTTVVTP